MNIYFERLVSIHGCQLQHSGPLFVCTKDRYRLLLVLESRFPALTFIPSRDRHSSVERIACYHKLTGNFIISNLVTETCSELPPLCRPQLPKAKFYILDKRNRT